MSIRDPQPFQRHGASGFGQHFRHQAADAAVDVMLLDAHHRLAGGDCRQQLLGITGTNRWNADNSGVNTFFRELCGGFHYFMYGGTHCHQRHILAHTQDVNLARGKLVVFVMQLRQVFPVQTDIDRPHVVERVVNDLAAFVRAGGGVNFDIAEAAHNGDIVDAVVGAGERAVAGTRVQTEQLHVGVVVADIDFDLLVSARDQKRRGVTGDGDLAANRQPGGGTDQRLLGDADVHQAARKTLHKRGDFCRGGGVCHHRDQVHAAIDGINKGINHHRGEVFAITHLSVPPAPVQFLPLSARGGAIQAVPE